MHRRTRAAVFALCVAVAVVPAAPLAAQTGERKVTIDEVPPAVQRAIREQVGDGRLVDIGVYQQDGKTVYEIEMVVAGKEHDVVFTGDGTVLRTTRAGSEEKAQTKSAPAGTPRVCQDEFFLAARTLATTGRGRFFVLEPGYQLVLEGSDGGKQVNLTITVLPETKQIGGIETRVVEERETVDGQLAEISRNFLAMCTETKSVFYFGEEVDVYDGGKVVGHEGAWLHGVNDARAGLLMPGEPLLGASYYQEVAPGVAMDRASIAATNVTLGTPAGTFADCLKVQEENPLDEEKEFKVHAPGIGLVQDENLLLVKHGFVKAFR